MSLPSVPGIIIRTEDWPEAKIYRFSAAYAPEVSTIVFRRIVEWPGANFGAPIDAPGWREPGRRSDDALVTNLHKSAVSRLAPSGRPSGAAHCIESCTVPVTDHSAVTWSPLSGGTDLREINLPLGTGVYVVLTGATLMAPAEYPARSPPEGTQVNPPDANWLCGVSAETALDIFDLSVEDLIASAELAAAGSAGSAAAGSAAAKLWAAAIYQADLGRERLELIASRDCGGDT